jgi:uncharacterized membrane protein
MATATIRAPARPVRDTGSATSRPYVNVGQAERLASVLGGGLLAAYGLSRGGLGGLALAAVGGGLIYRGATGHCGLYGALNMSTAGRGPATGVPAGAGSRLDEAVTIDRPPGALYLYWRNFENLPRFMPGLRSVTVEGNRSRWTVVAPLGASVTWEAEIINDKEGELIAWRSLPGSQVDTAGSVHFRRAPNGAGTEVTVEMKYNPPAGKVGDAAAWLCGDDGRRQVREALRAFKRLMEGGQRPAVAGRPTHGL